MKYKVTNMWNTNLSFFDGEKKVTLSPSESVITKNPPTSEGRFKVEEVRKESPKKEKKKLEGEE